RHNIIRPNRLHYRKFGLTFQNGSGHFVLAISRLLIHLTIAAHVIIDIAKLGINHG
ncbi:MAG: hypothetical protein FD128_2391, partial [Hyphomonadaceae bacterium]